MAAKGKAFVWSFEFQAQQATIFIEHPFYYNKWLTHHGFTDTDIWQTFSQKQTRMLKNVTSRKTTDSVCCQWLKENHNSEKYVICHTSLSYYLKDIFWWDEIGSNIIKWDLKNIL